MNILIIKTGRSETFDTLDVESEIISLGDVLRSTVILHILKSENIDWYTSAEAKPLILNNPFVNNIYIAPSELQGKVYDLVINLEKTKSVFSFMQNISFEKILGFYDCENIHTPDLSFNLKNWLKLELIKNLNWSEKLYILLGKKWCGEGYILTNSQIVNYHTPVKIGLNWKVGSKWPSKSWAFDRWTFLSKQLDGNFFYSWQEGFNDLDEYIGWINSCSTVVTHDSLGLHIAIALNKKIVALFGPTSAHEIYMGNSVAILSLKHDKSFNCLPCYKEKCDHFEHCMSKIAVEEVYKEIVSLELGSNE